MTFCTNSLCTQFNYSIIVIQHYNSDTPLHALSWRWQALLWICMNLTLNSSDSSGLISVLLIFYEHLQDGHVNFEHELESEHVAVSENTVSSVNSHTIAQRRTIYLASSYYKKIFSLQLSAKESFLEVPESLDNQGSPVLIMCQWRINTGIIIRMY